MAEKVNLDSTNFDDMDLETFKALVKGKKAEDLDGEAKAQEPEPKPEEPTDVAEAPVEEPGDEPEAEETDADSEDAPDEKPKHVYTKEEKAIIEQKNLNKQLKSQLAELQKKLDGVSISESAKQKAQKFIDKGYSDEEAKEQSEREARLEAYEARLETYEFRLENPDIVRKYPNIEVAKVKAVMSASGADVDSVIRMMYGSKPSVTEQAKATVIAEAKRAKSSAAGESSGSKPVQTVGAQPKLTPDEEVFRAHLEKVMGRAVSAKEFKEEIE